MKLNKDSELIVTIAVIALVVFILYKVSKPFADAIDSIKDVFGSGSEAKEAKQAVAAIESKGDTENPFSPRYLVNLQNNLKEGTKINYLRAAKKKELAEKVYKAASKWSGGLITGAIIGAKPSDLTDVFRQINYKSQVSDLATYFQQRYGLNMLTYITSGLKENQPLSQASDNRIITQIFNRVASLPAY
jgi:hypothetical protein